MRNDEDVKQDLIAAVNAKTNSIDIPCRVEVIAGIFNLSVRRIQQLTQEGVLPTADVTVNGRKTRRYLLIDTIKRYTTYLSDKANGKDGSDRMNKLKEQKLEAEIALKETQGELHGIKKDIAIGRYIDLETVELDYINFFIVFKKFCLSIPSRLAGRIRGSLDPIEVRAIEKDLNDEIVSMLNGFVVAGVSDTETGGAIG